MRARGQMEIAGAFGVGIVILNLWMWVLGYSVAYIEMWWQKELPWLLREPKSPLVPVLTHGLNVIVAVGPSGSLAALLGFVSTTSMRMLQTALLVGVVGYLAYSHTLFDSSWTVVIWFYSQYEVYLVVFSAVCGVALGRWCRRRALTQQVAPADAETAARFPRG